MPVKETPWGMMRQARAATHVPGGEIRPPKPGFLPPAPPPFSSSPVPPVLASVGVTGETVTYDRVPNRTTHEHVQPLTTTATTTPTTTPTPTAATNGSADHGKAPATPEVSGEKESPNHAGDHAGDHSDGEAPAGVDNAESSEYEYYDESEDDDDDGRVSSAGGQQVWILSITASAEKFPGIVLKSLDKIYLIIMVLRDSTCSMTQNNMPSMYVCSLRK
jgi:hypothetical protein